MVCWDYSIHCLCVSMNDHSWWRSETGDSSDGVGSPQLFATARRLLQCYSVFTAGQPVVGSASHCQRALRCRLVYRTIPLAFSLSDNTIGIQSPGQYYSFRLFENSVRFLGQFYSVCLLDNVFRSYGQRYSVCLSDNAIRSYKQYCSLYQTMPVGLRDDTI